MEYVGPFGESGYKLNILQIPPNPHQRDMSDEHVKEIVAEILRDKGPDTGGNPPIIVCFEGNDKAEAALVAWLAKYENAPLGPIPVEAGRLHLLVCLLFKNGLEFPALNSRPRNVVKQQGHHRQEAMRLASVGRKDITPMWPCQIMKFSKKSTKAHYARNDPDARGTYVHRDLWYDLFSAMQVVDP